MAIIILVVCIALQVYLTTKKVSPFLSLLFVSIFAGLSLGMDASTLMKSIEKGVGSTLGGLLLIVCLGAVLGKILEVSGAAERISSTLIEAFGIKRVQWAMMVTGICIGLPLYYTAGFVILIPLVFIVAKKTALPILYLALPMAASLSVTHCFLPPHPGPVLLVQTFQADMGMTLMYGLIIGLPAIVIGGPFLGRYFLLYDQKMPPIHNKVEPSIEKNISYPSLTSSLMIALMPVILITLSVLANLTLANGYLKSTIAFFGDSTIALLMSVIVGLYFLGTRQKVSIEDQMKWVAQAIVSVAMILLIITSGGIFKQVLIDSGTANLISAYSKSMQMSPLLFAWVVTALLRVAIGSATVAGITAAGIVSPLISTPGLSPELMVLSIGAGSVFGSHVNDSGFWMFKEYLGLSIKETFLSWTVMESVISIVGLIGVLALNYFI